jgi:hypothetical protein
LAALVFAAPVRADYTVVGGKYVVRDGQLTTLDLGKHIETHNQAAARLVNGT